jgi:hypothetical protein
MTEEQCYALVNESTAALRAILKMLKPAKRWL